jgi:16S rRNA (guanine527-N7)-methyltransferase
VTDPAWKGPELAERVRRALTALGYEPGSARGTLPLARAIERWAELVIEWNQRMDLTAARSPEELVDLLIADAAVLASRAGAGAEHWVDVGSGAGAPGLAIALLAPQLQLTLVEPKAKRVAFLRAVLVELGRSDVRVERARSEALAAQSFDAAVSRATLQPAEWVVEGARLARRRVWVLLAQSEPPPPPAGFRTLWDHRYQWPLGGASRRVVCFERGGSTPRNSQLG